MNAIGRIRTFALIASLPLVPGLAVSQVLFTPSALVGSSSVSGFIGIGTSAPAVKLDFGASVPNVPQILNLYTGGYARMGFGMDSATAGMRIYAPALGGNFVAIGSISYDASQTWTERMRVDTVTGNVGVGTAAPATKLQVMGDIAFPYGASIRVSPESASIWPSGTTKLVNVFYNANNQDQVDLYTPGSGRSTPVISYTAVGNVGIGTSSPTQTLQLGGGFIGICGPYPNIPWTWQRGDNGIILASAQTPQGYGWSYGSRLVTVDHGDGLNLEFDALYAASWTNAALVISGRSGTTGNVGIGTTNPTQKLSVNGAVRAKEVIVDTGWSDYVFKSDYRLAPLSEVEAHIKVHHALPGVPSEAQVAKEGISLGEMQAKLLAKIEELTLHQIEQEKEIAALKANNTALTAEVAALKQSR